MPAFMAHYTCGVLAQHELYGMHGEKAPGSPCAGALTAHQNVFHVGLAGPDLFFYSLYEQFRKGLKIGRAVHKYRTDQFLNALYKEAASRTGIDREIALAYYIGYLGHYSLDAGTHPYIYRVCDHPDELVALGKHFRFEAALDVRITEKYLGRDVNNSHLMGLIRLSHRERRVIAQMLCRAIHTTYPDYPAMISEARLQAVLLEYGWINCLLIDPFGIKEWMVLGIEKITRGYSLLSSLCINRNTYGITEEEFLRFDRRFMRAVKYFETILPYVDAAVNSSITCVDATENAGREPQQELRHVIGSRSYHTGRHTDGAATEIDWT